MHDPALWIALRDTPTLRRSQAHELLREFGGPERIFGRPSAELSRLCSPVAAHHLAREPDLTLPRAEVERARKAGLEIVLSLDPRLPAPLLEIPDPPVVLYLLGNLPRGPFVSVVGSRRVTPRGREAARKFAAALARAGAAVVSGLAYGVDAAAHAGALDVGGRTVAVLAGGLDRPGPAGNRPLARRIVRQGGACLSEHPPGTPSLAYHFPDRNRLISGLSRATLIVEARERSGSLWTARHAAEQGRDVLVIPGPIDTDACRGSNRLLLEGAIPVVDPEDAVVVALGRLDPLLPGTAPAPERLPQGDAGRVLERVRQSPCGPEDLIVATGLSPARIASVLLDLEIEGWITREGRRIACGPLKVWPSRG
jgi:DNA processing protein